MGVVQKRKGTTILEISGIIDLPLHIIIMCNDIVSVGFFANDLGVWRNKWGRCSLGDGEGEICLYAEFVPEATVEE